MLTQPWVAVARLVLVPVSLAVIIFTIAWTLRDVRLVANPAEESRDAVLAINADGEAPRLLRNPFAFVDLDERTDEALGHPDHTPHDKLARLLARVAAGKPALIVVDIDISWPDSHDDQLRATLEDLGRKNVAVLLEHQTEAAGGMPYPFRPSVFDGVVALYPSISWVTTETPNGRTAAVRRLREWLAACNGDTPVRIPGVGLASAWAYQQVAAHLPPKPVRALFAFPDWSCGPAQAFVPPAVSYLHHSVHIGSETTSSIGLSEAVRYTLRWDEDRKVSPQEIVDSMGHRRPLYAVLPALDLMSEKGPSPGAADYWLRNSIAVVGASNENARDMHATPLGPMPGAFILINHMRGLLDFGPYAEAAWWSGLLTTVLISILTAIATILLERFLGGWLDLLLPFAITGAWWLLLTLALGNGGYFGLAVTELVVAFVVRLTGAWGEKEHS